MVAYFKSALLLFIASAAAPSLAAPAPVPVPVPQSETERNWVLIRYHQGRSGREQIGELYIKNVDDRLNMRNRVGFYEIDKRQGALYDIELLNGPADVHCGFTTEYTDGPLPGWVPGQEIKSAQQSFTFDFRHPEEGPIKDVSQIWCKTSTGGGVKPEA